MGGGFSFTAQPKPGEERNVQDEARSFASKLGAMKILLKGPITQKSFLAFCDKLGKAEYMRYFEELEKFKTLKIEDANDKLKKLLPDSAVSMDQYAPVEGEDKHKNAIQCLEPLHRLKYKTFTQIELIRALGRSQDNLLTSLIGEFEEYLTTEECAKAKDQENIAASKMKTNKRVTAPTTKPVAKKATGGFFPIHV